MDGVLTDADGSFSAGNLAAGSYYLSASDQSSAGSRELRGRAGPVETYVTTYYPDVTDPSGAVAVHVTTGAVRRGVDIRMRRTVVYRITGKLIDSNSPNPPASASIFLDPKDTSNVALNAQATYRDGNFEFSGVPPGVYVLQASVRPLNLGMPVTGRQIVTVGNGDIDGLVVRLGQGMEIKGRIATEVSSSSPPAGTTAVTLPTVSLVSTDDSSPSGGAQTKQDGTFAFTGVSPGLYRITVSNAPAGTYVKSIRFGGQDATRTALDFTSGSGGLIDILLSPNAGDVSGVVRDSASDSNGQLLSGVTVTLWIPGTPAEGTIDFTRTQTTDINGQFKFPNLPPGEYRVAAWEQIEPGLAVVPEFRSKFESKATTVKLNERDHQTIEPMFIPRDSIEAEASKLR